MEAHHFDFAAFGVGGGWAVGFEILGGIPWRFSSLYELFGWAVFLVGSISVLAGLHYELCTPLFLGGPFLATLACFLFSLSF